MTNDKNIILIAGSPTSGKGTLGCFLDGHPDIFSLPFWHDKIATGLTDFRYNDFCAPWLGKNAKVLPILNAILTKTDFNVLELFANQGYCTYPVSANETLNFDLNIDYAELKQLFINTLMTFETSQYNPNNIIQVILNSLVKIFNRSNSYKYFVSHSTNGFTHYDKFLEVFPNSKILYVKRNRIDWLYSLAWRRCNCDHNKMIESINWIFQNDSRLKDLIWLENNIDNFVKKYPQSIKIIDFNELIFNPNTVIDEILSFLKIEKSDVAYTPSLFNKKLDLINEIKDDVNKIATSEEITLINNLFTNYVPPLTKIEKDMIATRKELNNLRKEKDILNRELNNKNEKIITLRRDLHKQRNRSVLNVCLEKINYLRIKLFAKITFGKTRTHYVEKYNMIQEYLNEQ